MKKPIGNLSANVGLSGWPAAVTCIFGIVVAGATLLDIMKLLVEHGYEIRGLKGLSITKPEIKKPEMPGSSDKQTKAKNRSGSDPKTIRDASASAFIHTHLSCYGLYIAA